MLGIKTSHIDERVPVRILRSTESGSEGRVLCDLMARRFMGVLVHPVPPLQMQLLAGRFHRGGKVFVDWPQDAAGWNAIQPGDQIEVEGKTLTIRVVRSSPVCYGELFVDGE